MLKFNIFGIPVSIHWMFWLLAALLGGGIGALESPSADRFIAVGLFMLAALISIVVHELGHALTGLKRGAPHVQVYLHGMGGLASFPGARFSKKDNLLTTAAGPGASLALGFIFSVIASYYLPEQRPATMGPIYFGYFVSTMATINIFWSIVNLMPVLPLDGGQILFALLGPERAKVSCIVSFITIALLAFVLWVVTRSIFNMIVMAFLASHTMQVWKSLKR